MEPWSLLCWLLTVLLNFRCTNLFSQPLKPVSENEKGEEEEEEPQETKTTVPATLKSPTETNGVKIDDTADTSERLDALARERDALRTEVSELRQSLEAIRSKHDEDVSGLKEQLGETQSDKEHAETQYKELLGRVNTIRAQLGERLKADAVCLGHSGTYRMQDLTSTTGRDCTSPIANRGSRRTESDGAGDQ